MEVYTNYLLLLRSSCDKFQDCRAFLSQKDVSLDEAVKKVATELIQLEGALIYCEGRSMNINLITKLILGGC